ncbi:MAG TPA: metallophosphoesterase [Anaerolineae bacterium]|nr:metallophosphoesterase [Anaerolineae bacterium]
MSRLCVQVLSINALAMAMLPIEPYAPTKLLYPIVVVFPTVFQFPLTISISFTVVGALGRMLWASARKRGTPASDRHLSPSRVLPGVRYVLGILALLAAASYAVVTLCSADWGTWRGPYLQSVTSDSVWVMWDTVEPSTGLVEYGLTPELGSIAEGSQAVAHHEVQLTGLSAQSVYYYRVDGGKTAHFRTAPASRQASVRFAVVGDTRTQHRMHRAVIEQMVRASPDLVLHTGDLVESGHDTSQWDRFFWIEAPLLRTAPFYPTLGGHEERASHYFDSFVLPSNERWYAFEYGPARLIALQIDGAFDPGYEQMRWLERQLSTNEAPWLLVTFHVPVYSSRGEDDLEVHLRHTLVPLFERYGVDVVLMGHQHSYERIVVDGITYVITAGGGAPLYSLDEPEPGSQVAVRAHHFLLIDLDPSRLTGTAIDRHGQVIDRFELLADRPLQVDHGCTSFCLDIDGQPVFGTNYDTVRSGTGLVFVNKRGVAKHGREHGTTGEVAHWISKYGSVTFNNTSYEHAWSGMNEAGLVISTMHLPATRMPSPDARPPLTMGQWQQYQLDNCSTVDEVIASDAQIRIRAENEDHHLVCDKTGKCATIEFIDGELVHHTGSTLPIKVLTNTEYASALAFLDRGHRRHLLDISLDRFALAAHMLDSYDPETSSSPVAYAFDVLARVGNRRRTQWSIVYDLQGLRVYFRTRSNGRVRCLDLTALDFSCRTPVQMLDVNADLSGNVADDLQPYSHEAALAQLWSFVQEVGLEDTHAESEAYIAHLESYACTEEGDLATGSQDVPSLGSGTCADHIPPLPERGFSALWLVGVAGATLAVYAVYWLYHAKRKR